MERYVYALVGRVLSVAQTRRQALVFGGLIFFINTGLLLCAALYENTLFMDGENQGLLELPGVIGILVGDLLTLSIIQWMVRQAVKMTRRFPADRRPSTRRYILISRNKMLSQILFRGKGIKIYAYMCIFASLFWINNAWQTLNPLKYYGCDVFGSIANPYGYIATKIVFFISWVILLPYIAYVSTVILLTFYRVTSKARRYSRLNFNIFHKDGCGGFSYLGDINITFVIGMLVIYGELMLVLFQHKHFNPGLVSGFAIATCVLIAGTYIMLYPLRGFLRKRKEHFLSVYSEKLMFIYDQETYSRYLHTKSHVSFNPYSGKEKFFLYAVRVLPFVVTSAKAYLHVL